MSAVLTAAALAGLAAPASAATLQEVTDFGPNPSGLRMHVYVPDDVDPRPAIVVAVHYCTGDGPAFYNNTEFADLADRMGFIVVYPTATRSGGCFDVYTEEALTRGGGSDPVSIKSMVDWTLREYDGDPDRVYATGASSGGMMTNVLLADYPDVFAAGAAFMGVPFGCFATTPPSEWNGDCADGRITKSPEAWGDLVRGAYPGYSGPYPRMQLWHGTQDSTLDYANFTEEIKQWTDVHAVSPTPVFTDNPRSGWTRTRYGGAGTTAPVEAISVQGVGHTLPLSGMAAMAVEFFGLDAEDPGTEPPEPEPEPSAECRGDYRVNAWNTGLTGSVTIANTGTAPVEDWSLEFTLPQGQAITSGWNATYSPQSGAVTAEAMPYNSMIAPGASIDIGFQATHTGNTDSPDSFRFNGAVCTAG
ncbi:PHB depolymerase family esterase [Streptomonospora sp. PA3]|nr:PHB depolymerase family esterase [Streptomonospora sp. PA3]MUL44054.1 PHB depolymerase family esterase [Streptomonospora sp. PA3]